MEVMVLSLNHALILGIIYFIENGGVFVYAHVRGGGEYGHAWWQAGRKLQKKNSILDLTATAQYLIDENYTNSARIGIMGTSHGGLIVAAAMIEQPKLFGAAVIFAGALDMLRIQNTETGSRYTNLNEFGNIKNKEDFKNIYSYAPFHTIKDTINYPAALIITGDNDDRVLPYQSYKFAGKLQNGASQKNPILLWTQNKVGHKGALKYNNGVKQNLYMYEFLLSELTK